MRLTLMTPPLPPNKPKNKHLEAPDRQKDHKPLLSQITVLPETRLLNKIPHASYDDDYSFTIFSFWHVLEGINQCLSMCTP